MEFDLSNFTLILGGIFSDVLNGPDEAVNNTFLMLGLSGDDELFGSEIPQAFGTLFGGLGDDRIVASSPFGTLLGGRGDDILDASLVPADGSFGASFLLGGSGDDQIFDSPFSDSIVGGHGDDQIKLLDDGNFDALFFSRSETARRDVDVVEGYTEQDILVLEDFDADDVDIEVQPGEGEASVTVLRFGGREVQLVDFDGEANIVFDIETLDLLAA